MDLGLLIRDCLVYLRNNDRFQPALLHRAADFVPFGNRNQRYQEVPRYVGHLASIQRETATTEVEPS